MCSRYRIEKRIDSDAIKEVGLEVNAEKPKYMFMSPHQNAGQSHNIKVAIRSLENMAKFKYVGTIVRAQNLFQEEINRRLNSDGVTVLLVCGLWLS
jgi:hypothetical protein